MVPPNRNVVSVDHAHPDVVPPRRTRVAETLTALGQLTIIGAALSAAVVFAGAFAGAALLPTPAGGVGFMAAVAAGGVLLGGLTWGSCLIGFGRLVELAERRDAQTRMLLAAIRDLRADLPAAGDRPPSPRDATVPDGYGELPAR